MPGGQTSYQKILGHRQGERAIFHEYNHGTHKEQYLFYLHCFSCFFFFELQISPLLRLRATTCQTLAVETTAPAPDKVLSKTWHLRYCKRSGYRLVSGTSFFFCVPIRLDRALPIPVFLREAPLGNNDVSSLPSFSTEVVCVVKFLPNLLFPLSCAFTVIYRFLPYTFWRSFLLSLSVVHLLTLRVLMDIFKFRFPCVFKRLVRVSLASIGFVL